MTDPAQMPAPANPEPISIAGRARPGSHGRLRQDELKVLTGIGLRQKDIHVLVVLRTRLSGRTRDVRDGNKSIAKWAGMSISSVKRALPRLEERAIVECRNYREGSRWVRSIRPLPYDWLDDPALRSKVNLPNDEPPNEGVTVDLSPEAAGGSEPRPEGFKFDGERSKPRGTIQRSSPESFPESETPLDEISPEDLVAAMTGRWRSTREASARTHFVDGVALRWLQNGIREALRTGCTPKDVRDAVDDHVDENFADPRELPRWAAQNRDDRMYRDREREVLRAKARREAEHDALVERERAERVARGVSLPSTFEDALASAAVAEPTSAMAAVPAQLSLAGFEECTEPLMPFLRKDRAGWGVTLQLRSGPRNFYGKSPDEASSKARRWRRRHLEELGESG